MIIRRITMLVAAALLALALSAPVAFAAPLPDNCTKDQGTVTCTTTEGPGKNQGGVGTTETTETQGNTTNKSPEEQQNLEDTCNKKPPSSQGGPIGDCPAP
jgi:hypothetical protein